MSRVSPHRLTLGIVTYKRPKLLKQCLDGLNQQTISPSQLIIVDNDPKGSANQLILHKTYKFRVAYFDQSQSTPKARNTILNACQTPWLGFIDDDCIVDKNWISAAYDAINSAPEKTGYFVGLSQLANPESLAARCQYQLYLDSFKQMLDPQTNLLAASSLDTKNCIINIAPVRQFHLQFDPQFFTTKTSGLEDTDFGMQLNQHGYKGRYWPAMVVKHYEKTLGEGLLSKAYHRGRLRYIYGRKWTVKNPWLEMAVDLKFWRDFLFEFPKLYAYLQWLKEKLANKEHFSKKIELLTQQLYILSFNQGYLDEQKAHLHKAS